MSLTDGDVAALAGQAVDLLAADIDITIQPGAADDPYRRGQRSWTVWPKIDGERGFGIPIYGVDTPIEALARLIDLLSEYGSESARFWGAAFPVCPGHVHPARVAETTTWAVVLRCPETRDIIGQIWPDVLD